MGLVDWEASKKIAKLVDAEIGTCVVNAARAFRYFRSDLPEDAVYVEGLWKVGGQPHFHTWIEASDAIIDPTLVCEPNSTLRETTTHHPINRLGEDQVAARFEGESLDPGHRLEMELSWDDPRVDELLQRIDPP